MSIKKMLFIVFSFVLTSCTINITEELTSNHDNTKSITVNLQFPEGAYAYATVYTNLRDSSSYARLHSGETIYSHDNGVIVDAVCSSGYLFSEWIGNDIADIDTSRTSVLLNTSKTITGVFVEDTNPSKITVRCKASDGGEIYFHSERDPYNYNGDTYYSSINKNMTIDVEAIPYEEYEFSHWIDDKNALADKNANQTYITTKNYNITIEAVFIKIPNAKYDKIND